MTKTTILTTDQISSKIDHAMDVAKTESTMPTFSVNYDPKKVKIDFDASNEFKHLLCRHYSESKFMGSIMNYVSNNQKFYEGQIAKFADKEELTDENKADLATLQTNIATIKACGRTFRRKQNIVINDVCNAWNFSDERILNAYENRLLDCEEWKNALGAFFTQYGVTMSDSLYTHINTLVGVKSASISKKLQGEFIQGYKGKALYMLLMDIMVDLAIRKRKIAWSIVEKLKGEKLMAISEFDNYVVVDAMTVANTVAEIKATLDSAGIEYKSNAKKAELLEAFRQAEKEGAITVR